MEELKVLCDVGDVCFPPVMRAKRTSSLSLTGSTSQVSRRISASKRPSGDDVDDGFTLI